MDLPDQPQPSSAATSARTREEELLILEALERICASGALGGGERLPAMLRYVVREELAGRGARLKSFAIATEVLGRSADFDPQSDGIARAEMTRLRKALEHVNATAASGEAVRIMIPKGSYRPQFRLPQVIEQEPSPFAPRPRWLPLAIMLLLVGAVALLAALGHWRADPAPAAVTAGEPALNPPLLVLLPGEPDAALAPALDDVRAEIAEQLSHQPWLTVVRPSTLAAVAPALANHALRRPIYLLELHASDRADGGHIRAFLKRWPDQSIKWTRDYPAAGAGHPHSPDPAVAGARDSASAVSDVARWIAADVATPGGAITMAETARMDDAALAARRYACFAQVRRYWRDYDMTNGVAGRACIEKLLAEDPTFPDGRAALALLLIDEARRSAGPARQQTLAEAQAHVFDLDLPTPLPQMARMALGACLKDPRMVKSAAEKLLAAFPNNPGVLSDVGSKLGLALGDWPRALQLEARALSLNPLPDPWYPLATLTRAMLDGAPAKALSLLLATPQRGFITGHVALLAAAGLAGDAKLAADARKLLDADGLASEPAIMGRIEGECWSEEVKAAFRKGVAAAGASLRARSP